MKKYQNIKKNTKIGLYISMALMVFCFILRVISLVSVASGDRKGAIVNTVISLVVATLIIIYAFWGYKKPHGDLLKYTMLLFGASLLLNTQGGREKAAEGFIYLSFASGIASMMIAYIGGRLQKIERNRILMIIVGVILVVLAARQLINATGNNILRQVVPISNVVNWLTLCVAYTARYEEHREAGLMDTTKKEQ